MVLLAITTQDVISRNNTSIPLGLDQNRLTADQAKVVWTNLRRLR
jgi:hypothetical protein